LQQSQSIHNYKRVHPIQHFFWLPLSGLTILASIGSLIAAALNSTPILGSILILATAIIGFISGFLARRNALIVQDRVIRMEEQFRYFRLKNNMPPEEITIQQWIALRFASDEEFLALTDKAAQQKLSPEQIKQAVKSWRVDHYRV